MSRDKAAGRGDRRTPASLTQAIEENSIWHRLKRTLLLPVALCLLRALCSRRRLCRLRGSKCRRNKMLGTVRHAIQLAGQLPEDTDDSLLIIDAMRELVLQYLVQEDRGPGSSGPGPVLAFKGKSSA